MSKLEGMSITQILWEENTRSDQLACLASSSESKLQGVKVEYLSELSVSSPYGMEVNLIDTGCS